MIFFVSSFLSLNSSTNSLQV